MRISIQNKLNERIDIEFGYNTALFSSMYGFSIAKVYLSDQEVDHFDDDGYYVGKMTAHSIEHAALIFSMFMHPKHWKQSLENSEFNHPNVFKRIKSLIYS